MQRTGSTQDPAEKPRRGFGGAFGDAKFIEECRQATTHIVACGLIWLKFPSAIPSLHREPAAQNAGILQPGDRMVDAVGAEIVEPAIPQVFAATGTQKQNIDAM